jgi:wobble nucleotide-excising tRNase
MDAEYQQDAPMDMYPCRMTAKHARHARSLGEGNLSEGIRTAIAVAYKLAKETREEPRKDMV